VVLETCQQAPSDVFSGHSRPPNMFAVLRDLKDVFVISKKILGCLKS
jgi:hypothetical protein